MKDLIPFSESSVLVKTGSIEFRDYELIKEQAQKLAEHVEEIEVTEDNIKTSKKLVSEMNKVVKDIDSHRIAIKKQMLESYNDFESQVRDITNIAKRAENAVRSQIRTLEEKERDEKLEVIKDIFDKRIKQYDFEDQFYFTDFIKPKHLNKSTSLTSVETEMVNWLESIHKDIETIKLLDDGVEVLTEYFYIKDFTKAVQNVKQREEQRKQAEKVVKPKLKNTVEKWCITVNERDALTLEMFMKHMKINYKIEKVEK